MRIAALILLVPLVARADKHPAFEAPEMLETVIEMARENAQFESAARIHFAFDQQGNAWYAGETVERHSRGNPVPKNTVVAIATDQKSAWLATDLEEHELFYDGPEHYVAPVKHQGHAVLLAERDSKGMIAPIAAHVAIALDAKTQAKVEKDPYPSVMDASISDDAKPVVELFTASAASAKTLAATVSKRKDVVLYGSGIGERFVGGDAVRAQLLKWNLAIVPTQVRAELTSSKTVAWLGANVDVRSGKKPAVRYRVLGIYEQTAGTWQLVSLSFSLVNAAFNDD